MTWGNEQRRFEHDNWQEGVDWIVKQMATNPTVNHRIEVKDMAAKHLVEDRLKLLGLKQGRRYATYVNRQGCEVEVKVKS